MRNYKRDGKTISYVNAGSAIASGDVVVLAMGIGVAVTDIAASTGTGELCVEGVVELAKNTGEAFTVGQRLYWDSSSTGELTGTKGANKPAGYCAKAAGSSDTLAQIKLVEGIDDETDAMDQAANVADLGGTLTGSETGAMADVADIALSTSNTYTDAAVNSAVNTAIAEVNLQLKELQVKVNELLGAQKASGQMEADA